MLAYIVYGKSGNDRVDLADPGGQAVALKGGSGEVAQLGAGADFDGDKRSENPLVLGDPSGSSASDGYLIGVDR